MRPAPILASLAAAALLLTGCSSTPDAPASTPPAAPATTDTAAVEARDITPEVKAAAGEHADKVTTAMLDEANTVAVETTITDPRGDNGSPEAQAALAICEAVAEVADPAGATIREADGTGFVVYRQGKCLEV